MPFTYENLSNINQIQSSDIFLRFNRTELTYQKLGNIYSNQVEPQGPT